MLTQAVLLFKLEVTDETITPHAGLAIFGEFMRALGLPGALDRLLVRGARRGMHPGVYPALRDAVAEGEADRLFAC